MKKAMLLFICLIGTTSIIKAALVLKTTRPPLAKLISMTRNVIDEEAGISAHPEAVMAYIARVSNPENQANPDYAGLIKYCIRNKHWSVFEHAYMTLKIRTTLAIATQILRHRSFTFQQFSQRYADASVLAPEFVLPDLRRQDLKNRQNSIDDIASEIRDPLLARIQELNAQVMQLYKDMLAQGIAKECARFVLPQATTTELFVTGNARSWIHYLEQRTSVETQKEHREVALACQKIFIEQFPTIAQALNWTTPQKV